MGPRAFRCTPTKTGEPVLEDWNVVATARGGAFRRAWTLLEGTVAAVDRTKYPNVLVCRAGNIREMMDHLQSWVVPGAPDPISKAFYRITPGSMTFEFDNANDFHTRLRTRAASWAEILAGHSFQVRIHRHGFKSAVASQSQSERMLEQFLLSETQKIGAPARVDYHNPAGVLVVETVDQRGGMSLFSRKELQHYSFLHTG